MMSPSQSFPFLQLPLLAQLEVLKNMNHMAFLTFSVLSERSKAIAVETKYQLKACRWIFDGSCWIGFQSDFVQCQRPVLYFPNQKNSGSLMKSAIIRLNGQDIRIFVDGGSWIVDDSSRSEWQRLKLMDAFTEHLFTIFRFKGYELDLCSRFNIVGCFLWKYTTTFKDVFINDRFELTGSGIQFVMQHLKITKLTVRRIQIAPEFEYTGPLTMETLEIPTIDWMSRESIRNMKCSWLWIDNLVDAKKLNTMLKEWQRGGLANLESLRTPVRRGDVHKVLRGIRTFAWDPETRPKCWRNELFNGDIDLSTPNCDDIVGVDGKLATVKINDNRSQLELFVWHLKYFIK